MEQRLDAKQFELMRGLRVIVGNIFPNLSFLETAATGAHEWAGPEDLASMSFLTLRLWQPRGPDWMEVWTWQLMDRSAPDWWKQASRECYLREFGPGGMFEQDDMANWSSITQNLESPAARRISLQYGMGLGALPLEEWPGPGLATRSPAWARLANASFMATGRRGC